MNFVYAAANRGVMVLKRRFGNAGGLDWGVIVPKNNYNGVLIQVGGCSVRAILLKDRVSEITNDGKSA